MALKKAFPQFDDENNGVTGEYVRLVQVVPPAGSRLAGWGVGTLQFEVFRDQAAADENLAPIRSMTKKVPPEFFYGLQIVPDWDGAAAVVYNKKSEIPGLEDADGDKALLQGLVQGVWRFL